VHSRDGCGSAVPRRPTGRCRRTALRATAERIILIKTTVFDAAYGALKSSGLPVVNRRIPFPSTGQQKRFREQFAEALGSELNSM
jgi:hypothetical protein